MTNKVSVYLLIGKFSFWNVRQCLWYQHGEVCNNIQELFGPGVDVAFELNIFLFLGRKFSSSNQHIFFPWEFRLIHENVHCSYNYIMLLGYFPAKLCIIPLCLFWKFVTCYWVHVPGHSNTNSVIDCFTEGNTTLKCQCNISILSDFFFF